MMPIVHLISIFKSVFRGAGNLAARQSVKKIVHKLETNTDYKESKLEELYFTVGKVIDANYAEIYNLIKSGAMQIQTNKYEVKAVVDIDASTFLIFVLCVDHEVRLVTESVRTLSKRIKLRYFKVTKKVSETVVEINSNIYIGNEEKFLLTDFYKEIEKQIEK